MYLLNHIRFTGRGRRILVAYYAFSIASRFPLSDGLKSDLTESRRDFNTVAMRSVAVFWLFCAAITSNFFWDQAPQNTVSVSSPQT
jgi:hypothetical protein